jgi:hypothetical protein
MIETVRGSTVVFGFPFFFHSYLRCFYSLVEVCYDLSMARIVRLIRRVTATAGGWAGDGTVWDGDDPANAPKAATIQATEATTPIATAGAHPRTAEVGQIPSGWSGIMRVLDNTGAPSSKRFALRIVLGWKKDLGSGLYKVDWQEPVGDSPPTPPDARNIGDGEDFTTEPLNLLGQDVAFHLVPVGGNLTSGHKVEIWASEVT